MNQTIHESSTITFSDSSLTFSVKFLLYFVIISKSFAFGLPNFNCVVELEYEMLFYMFY